MTVKMLDGDLYGDIRRGEILTMHEILEVVKLECIKTGTGESVEIPVDIEACVESTFVYDQAPYHTIRDLMIRQRDDAIEWVMVTRGFTYQGSVYHPGTTFQIPTDDNNGSINGEDEAETTDQEDEYLSVEMHPGRLMVFLPAHVRGEFYKTDSPYNSKQQKLIELKNEEMPLLITPSLKTFPSTFVQNTGLTNEMLLVERKKTEKLVIASSSRDGEFFLHVFPLTLNVFCEILLGGVPVDMLKEKEMHRVEKQLLPTLHHQMEYMVSLPYDAIKGIDRPKKPLKLKSKLKKKDIKLLGKQDESDDYPRYTAKPTSLMKELGQTISGTPNETNNTIVRMRTIVKKSKFRFNNNFGGSCSSSGDGEDSGEDKVDGNFDTVASILKDSQLEKYEELFLTENIDFRNLMQCDENDLLELGLETNEIDRLCNSLCQRSSFMAC